jgi:hypothetical protein
MIELTERYGKFQQGARVLLNWNNVAYVTARESDVSKDVFGSAENSDDVETYSEVHLVSKKILYVKESVKEIRNKLK